MKSTRAMMRPAKGILGVAVVLVVGVVVAALAIGTRSNVAIGAPAFVLEDRGPVEERLEIGPIVVMPSPSVMAQDLDAVELLSSSNALEMVRGGSDSPIESGFVVTGLVSDHAMSSVEQPDRGADVTAPPVMPTRDVPAIVVVIPDVLWAGLRGGGGPYRPDASAQEPAVTQRSTIVVAFDGSTGEFLFLRTVPQV